MLGAPCESFGAPLQNPDVSESESVAGLAKEAGALADRLKEIDVEHGQHNLYGKSGEASAAADVEDYGIAAGCQEALVEQQTSEGEALEKVTLLDAISIAHSSEVKPPGGFDDSISVNSKGIQLGGGEVKAEITGNFGKRGHRQIVSSCVARVVKAAIMRGRR